jgi:hypothetical protein
MRALIKENPTEGYALKEIPIPEPGEDELVFKVEMVNKNTALLIFVCLFIYS